MFQKISDRLFSLPWFIKKVPIHERPQYIIDMCKREGAQIFTSDYTSFEAHFDAEVMEACEFVLYEHMVQFLPDGAAFLNLIQTAMTKKNYISFKLLDMEINAKRMSGEMNTSLGNGFFILMCMLFVCEELNCNSCVQGVVEGDDGLFVMVGEVPPPKLFSDFGLNIKIVLFDELNVASFCGMIFDVDDRTIVNDPIQCLVNFGWTSAKYAKSNQRTHMHLLRAKALSMAYQYRGCPILAAFSYKICQLTASYDVKGWIGKQRDFLGDSYKLEILRQAFTYFETNDLLKEPGLNTRNLVEKVYGIPVSVQLSLERKIANMTEISPLNFSEIYDFAKPEWCSYFDRYSIRLPYNSTIDLSLIEFAHPREKAFNAGRKSFVPPRKRHPT